MKTASEDIVGRVVGSKGVRFTPAVSSIGQEVGDDVVDSLNVLGCDATIGR